MRVNQDMSYRLWLANTVRANLANCARLAELCSCELDADKVSAYITDIAGKKKRGERSSPFPEVLRGRLRGMFQPKHLMLKLACVRDAGTAISYEFLLEYGLFEPTVGIYFGIKAVSDSDVSDDVFIARVDNAIETLSLSSPRLFSGRRLHSRPLTDNAENGSYWPLWLPSPATRDLRDEIIFLRKLYRHFIKSFPQMTVEYDNFGNFIPQPCTAAKGPLAELLERITAIFASDESTVLFRKFIENANRDGILADCGNGQWEFNKHWGLNSRKQPLKMTQKAAFDLITILFTILAQRYHITRSRIIPWKQLRAVLLHSKSRPFDDSWQRQKAPSSGTPYYQQCKAKCLQLMELSMSDL